MKIKNNKKKSLGIWKQINSTLNESNIGWIILKPFETWIIQWFNILTIHTISCFSSYTILRFPKHFLYDLEVALCVLHNILKP